MGATAMIIVIPALTSLLVSLKIPMISERYLIVTVPFFLMLLLGGQCLQGIRNRVAIGLFFLLLIMGDLAYFFNPDFGKAQWREAAQYVSQEVEKDEIIFVEPDYAAGVFAYYLEGDHEIIPLSYKELKMDPSAIEKMIREANRDHKRLVLVTSGASPESGLARTLGRFAIETNRRVFPRETGITFTLW